jgi:uncharacterized membrane protein YeiH
MTTLALVLEHFAVATCAASGVLAARGKRVDLFGVIVLAVVTAFGGGTIRDLLLGSTPIFWVERPAYLYNAAVTAAIVFLVIRFRELEGTGMLVADAFGLALFSIVGARKALAFNLDPIVAVAMGVVTGVAGGILRDVLLGQIPLVFRREIHFYATASLGGCVMFLALEHFWPQATANSLIAIAFTLLLRFVSIRWKLALPDLKSKP